MFQPLMPIVMPLVNREEIRSGREELARRFNCDIKAIGKVLRRQQRPIGQKPATRPPKRVNITSA